MNCNTTHYRANSSSVPGDPTLLLAIIGLFGILAYSVQQRVREFGVRMAVGADARHVVSLVVGSALTLIAVGSVIGLGLATVLARFITSVLFGVAPLDAVTFAGVAVLLIVTAIVSTAGPAWRVSRIDPAVALRGQ